MTVVWFLTALVMFSDGPPLRVTQYSNDFASLEECLENREGMGVSITAAMIAQGREVEHVFVQCKERRHVGQGT